MSSAIRAGAQRQDGTKIERMRKNEENGLPAGVQG
jgi:hypothetical protein